MGRDERCADSVRPDRLKAGLQRRGSNAALLALQFFSPPDRAMLQRPFRQRLLETDVAAQSLAFDPLVPQDFVTLGEEHLIQIFGAHGFGGFGHWGRQWNTDASAIKLKNRGYFPAFTLAG